MGADAIGVIAVPSSPRFLAPALRPELFAAVAGEGSGCFGVLVVADPDDDQLEELTAAQGHAVVQLHGNESVERCRELGQRLDARLWKAVRVRSPADLERAAAYDGVVEALLLDAWVPGQLGGTGHRIPHRLAGGFPPAVALVAGRRGGSRHGG